MTRSIFGLISAFALFAASFALHIVGGATDQGWLFAIAVGLIFLTATGFPAIALVLSGELFRQPRRGTKDADCGLCYWDGTDSRSAVGRQ